ncbi:LysR family transcriptional regulator [Brevirhabdus pacifica]|uniref:LysR family transcriptional regulator n=1 Tax=Brevirhabdus pacifica TaxID=1267768 RepID=A0A1U7DG50_9RHOB|nr:LysR family transcriptional regulator [Brevirhabdus pacifica]APX88980.1 LysR family transcriptional regulator [Brevirhabdus pacifica]OWU80201.1 LysR family transcriptional regulator [Loktanella sp. 22II-4b]PJJ86459.1 LysR family transcriptional regulator [Brevirhabdus pacifica]
MRNLDVGILRSFVAVAETGGVTRAAGYLNLTQSAVSMQLKRLEAMMNLELIDRSGRRVGLTLAGEQLLTYARRMVEMNDEAFQRMTDQGYEGEIILGVPNDIVYPVIPRVLQRFNAEFPRMRVQLLSLFTSVLKRMFARGEVDLILTTELGLDAGGETLTDVPLRWIGAPEGQAWRERPLPLAHCRHCTFRGEVRNRLDAAHLPWVMAVESDSDRTVEATVSADLAVTTMLEGTEPRHLSVLPHNCGLPNLGSQRINLYGTSSGRADVIEPLRDFIRQGFATI